MTAHIYKMFLAVIAMFSITLASCSDENQPANTPLGNLQNHGLVGAAAINPSNPNNPYDIYGQTHRAVYIYFLENTTYTGSNYDELYNEFFNLRLEYLLDADPYGLSVEQYTALNDYDKLHQFDTVNVFWNFYLDSVLSIISNVGFQTNAEVTNFVASVRELEAFILEDGTLGEENKKKTLIGTSQLRYEVVLRYEQSQIGSLYNSWEEEVGNGISTEDGSVYGLTYNGAKSYWKALYQAAGYSAELADFYATLCMSGHPSGAPGI
jgi:hypothetical protein